MCVVTRSYVWEHLEMGYVQGMCDLLAPLMVVLDDGELAHLHLLLRHKYTVKELRFTSQCSPPVCVCVCQSVWRTAASLN